MIVVEIMLGDRNFGKHGLAALPHVGDGLHLSDSDGIGTVATVTGAAHSAIRLDGLGCGGVPLVTIYAVEND